jgi:hypothetical protein
MFNRVLQVSYHHTQQILIPLNLSQGVPLNYIQICIVDQDQKQFNCFYYLPSQLPRQAGGEVSHQLYPLNI